MKSEKLITILTVILIGVLLVLLQSCSPGAAEPGEDEMFYKQIEGAWNLNNGKVTFDDIDVTGAFKGWTITFLHDRSWIASKAFAPVWQAAGTFSLIKSGENFALNRMDGITVSIRTNTGTQLVMELVMAPGGARTYGLSGKYRFEMNR